MHTDLLKQHAAEQGSVELRQGAAVRQAAGSLLKVPEAEPVGLAEDSKRGQELRHRQRVHQARVRAGIPHQRLHGNLRVSIDVPLWPSSACVCIGQTDLLELFELLLQHQQAKTSTTQKTSHHMTTPLARRSAGFW